MARWELLRRRRGTAADDAAAGRRLRRAEALAGVRRLELRTRGYVESLFGGEHTSVFVGRGFEFSHVRPYVPGDDVRTIDWRVTARRGVPHVRRFVEERDLHVALVVDVSASCRITPGPVPVSDVASEVVAALVYATVRSHDRTSLHLVTDRVEHAVSPGSGPRHASRLLQVLLTAVPGHPGTDLASALEDVLRGLPRRSLLFLVSDLAEADPSGALGTRLAQVTARHELVVLHLEAPATRELPDVGWLEITDPETGARAFLDTSSSRERARYREALRRERERVGALVRDAGAELVDLTAEGEPLAALRRFLLDRRGRAGRR